MKQRNGLFESLVYKTDLLGEASPGQTLIEIAGENRLLIENHSGVTAYGCNEIHIRVKYGQIYIFGRNLELAQMTRNQLVITGQIDSVSLCRGIK